MVAHAEASGKAQPDVPLENMMKLWDQTTREEAREGEGRIMRIALEATSPSTVESVAECSQPL